MIGYKLDDYFQGCFYLKYTFIKIEKQVLLELQKKLF